jgi:hypothetical protein
VSGSVTELRKSSATQAEAALELASDVGVRLAGIARLVLTSLASEERLSSICYIPVALAAAKIELADLIPLLDLLRNTTASSEQALEVKVSFGQQDGLQSNPGELPDRTQSEA